MFQCVSVNKVVATIKRIWIHIAYVTHDRLDANLASIYLQPLSIIWKYILVVLPLLNKTDLVEATTPLKLRFSRFLWVIISAVDKKNLAKTTHIWPTQSLSRCLCYGPSISTWATAKVIWHLCGSTSVNSIISGADVILPTKKIEAFFDWQYNNDLDCSRIWSGTNVDIC